MFLKTSRIAFEFVNAWFLIKMLFGLLKTPSPPNITTENLKREEVNYHISYTIIISIYIVKYRIHLSLYTS